MNGLFKVWLSLSVSGTILIIALFSLKCIYQKQFSRQWQYYIWLIVIARLLLPVAPEQNPVGTLFWRLDAVFLTDRSAEQDGPLTAESLSDRQAQISHYPPNVSSLSEQNDTNSHGETLPFAPAPNTLRDGTTTNRQPSSSLPQAFQWLTKAIQTIFPYMGYIWLTIAFGLLLRKITIYQSFTRYLLAGQTEVTDISLLECLGQSVEQLHIKKTVSLFRNHLIASPLLTGFFHPCIVIPSTKLTEADFRYTILHELIHEKRHDLFYKWLVTLTVCLHWFNPFIYLMAHEINRACELSCDEAVIGKLKVGEIHAYGGALIHAVAAEGAYRDASASVTFYEGKKLLKERLESIMNCKKTSGISKCIVLTITFLLIGSAYSIGAYAIPVSQKSTAPMWQKDYHYYTQAAYYTGDYLVEIGYNISDEAQNAYPIQKELPLSDGALITVSFSKEAENSANDREALAAVCKTLSMVEAEIGKNSEPLQAPLIIRLEKLPSGLSAKQLADSYYQEDDLVMFAALFKELTDSEKNSYADSIYRDDRIAFFGATADHMSQDNLTKIAKQARDDHNAAFFSVALNHLESPNIRRFAELSYEECDIASFSILLPLMSDQEKKYWLDRAVQDKELSFISILKDEKGWYSSEGEPDDYIAFSDIDHTFDPSWSKNTSSNVKLVNEMHWDASAVTELFVDYVSDNLVVCTSLTEEIILKEYMSVNQESYYATASVEGATLAIKNGKRPKTSNPMFKSRIELYVPAQAEIQANLTTVSGNISADALTTAKLAAKSTSGNISINQYHGALSCETLSGNLSVTEYQGALICEALSGAISIHNYQGELACTTASGHITVTDSTFTGKASSASGDIDLQPAAIAGDLTGSSISGDVMIRLPASSAFSIDASTKSGRASNQFKEDFSSSNRTVRGNRGEHPTGSITLSSVSGDVQIKKD